METRSRWRNGWRFVAVARPRKNLSAMGRIRRLDFKRRKKQFPNPLKADQETTWPIVIERDGECAFFIS
jgi:hypothetical protein